MNKGLLDRRQIREKKFVNKRLFFMKIKIIIKNNKI